VNCVEASVPYANRRNAFKLAPLRVHSTGNNYYVSLLSRPICYYGTIWDHTKIELESASGQGQGHMVLMVAILETVSCLCSLVPT